MFHLINKIYVELDNEIDFIKDRFILIHPHYINTAFDLQTDKDDKDTV